MQSCLVDADERVGYLQDGTMSVSTAVASGRSVADFDTYSALGVSTCSVDFTEVAVMTDQPMMAIALQDPSVSAPSFDGVFRHAATGDSITNDTGCEWLMTSAKLSYSEGSATESWSAILQGAPVITQPAAGTAPTKRTDISDAAHGKTAVVALAIGPLGTASIWDFVDFFESFDIDVSISTVESHATLDRWTFPTLAERKITINASRVVEAPATVEAFTGTPATVMATPASHLAWTVLNCIGAVVAVAITFGNKSYTGNFAITDTKWSHGGDGAQKETITLENIGPFGVA
jgi:hypothetical protein